MPNVWPYVALELLNSTGNWTASHWMPSYSDPINLVSAIVTIVIVFSYAWKAAKRDASVSKIAFVGSMIWVLSIIFMAITSVIAAEQATEMSLVIKGIMLSGVLLWPVFLGVGAAAAWLSRKSAGQLPS